MLLSTPALMEQPVVLGLERSHEPSIRPLYSELGAQQVRLLSFGQEDLEWVMSLEVFALDNCPPYAALSYRWDDATVLGRPYSVDQHMIQPPLNLNAALESLIKHVRLRT